MTEANTQAVVEDTNVEATPSTAADNAQGNDLASFLEDYEKNASPQTPQPQPKQAADETSVVVELKSRLEAIESKQVLEKNTKDFNDAVSQIKGDLDVPEFVVKGWLLDHAGKNKAIDKIFDNRESNPQAFKQMLARMQKDFAATTSKVLGKQVDANATEDRQAVAAAVKGATTRAPESRPPDIGKMSDHEFREYQKSIGIKSAI